MGRISQYPQMKYYKHIINTFLPLLSNFHNILLFSTTLPQFFTIYHHLLATFHYFPPPCPNLLLFSTTVPQRFAISSRFSPIFNISRHLAPTLQALYQLLSVKTGYLPFFSSSGKHQSHHFVQCHDTGINS